MRGDKNGRLSGRVRHGNFDWRAYGILFAAAKTKPAFGDVVALDDFFVETVYADASCEVDTGTHVTAAIWFSRAGERRRRRRF